MAYHRTIRPASTICASCARQRFTQRRQFSASLNQHYDEAASGSSSTPSHLPRVVQPSLWRSLIPKSLRRDPAIPKKPSAFWSSPFTPFLILGLVVGSNAINIINERREMLNFTRKTEAKLALLREVVQKVRRGEEVDVKKVLGTGDPREEEAWEEVMREIEDTGGLGAKRRGRKEVEGKRDEGMETKKKVEAEDMEAGAREGAVGQDAKAGQRPKFMM